MKKVSLVSYLKKYWFFALVSPLMMAGEVIVDLMQPKLMKLKESQGEKGVDLSMGVSDVKATKNLEETEILYDKFIAELQNILRPKGITISSVGNMFTPFFRKETPTNFQEVSQSNQKEFARFWRYRLNNGVYLSPSQFEANFVSIQHTEKYLSDVLEIAKGY